MPIAWAADHGCDALEVYAAVTEPIPETSAAERVVADVYAIGAQGADAVRVRDCVPLWFHTFALSPGIYTPGIARDHGYRLAVLGADRFADRSVLDIGAFDGFYSFLAEDRGARRVVAVDNEQYVDWVHARFGVTLPGAAGFQAIAKLTASQVEYRRMDALDVHELDERFDVVLCFGILHRVTDPIALLRALAGVLAPGGEIVLETYGSRLGPIARQSRFASPATCTPATTSSTGASRRRVCADLGASSASTMSRSSISQTSTVTRGSSRCCEPRTERVLALFRLPTMSRQARGAAPLADRS